MTDQQTTRPLGCNCPTPHDSRAAHITDPRIIAARYTRGFGRTPTRKMLRYYITANPQLRHLIGNDLDALVDQVHALVTDEGRMSLHEALLDAALNEAEEALAAYRATDGEHPGEVVALGLDGVSRPILRYRGELNFPDHLQTPVRPEDRRRWENEHPMAAEAARRIGAALNQTGAAPDLPIPGDPDAAPVLVPVQLCDGAELDPHEPHTYRGTDGVYRCPGAEQIHQVAAGPDPLTVDDEQAMREMLRDGEEDTRHSLAEALSRADQIRALALVGCFDIDWPRWADEVTGPIRTGRTVHWLGRDDARDPAFRYCDQAPPQKDTDPGEHRQEQLTEAAVNAAQGSTAMHLRNAHRASAAETQPMSENQLRTLHRSLHNGKETTHRHLDEVLFASVAENAPEAPTDVDAQARCAALAGRAGSRRLAGEQIRNALLIELPEAFALLQNAEITTHSTRYEIELNEPGRRVAFLIARTVMAACERCGKGSVSIDVNDLSVTVTF
jgi:hypothetical protein